MARRELYHALNGEAGGALLISLGIMILLMTAALIAVDTAQTDVDLSFNQLHSDQAFYVAEAGLQRAVNQLNNNNCWDTGYAAVDFEEGIYSVAVIHSNIDTLTRDTVVIRSAGTVSEANANLEGLVVPRLWQPFQFAMFGDTSLGMQNNTCTDSYNSDSGTYISTIEATGGDVASNGEIDLINTAIVGGDASSAEVGGIDICPTCTVRGDLTDGVAPYVLDPIPDSEFVWAHDNNSAPGGLSGGYSYDGLTHQLILNANDVVMLTSGVYYFSELNLGVNSQLMIAPGAEVKMYLEGDVTLQNNTSVNPDQPPSSLLIYSRGSILTMGMNIDIHAAFYAPDADVSLTNACEFYGSIVAASVLVDNSVCVHYDRALSDFAAGVTGEMVLIAWRQL